MLTILHPAPEQVARVRELLTHVPPDAVKRRVGELCVHGLWRGQDAWLVGYRWTRASGEPRPDQIREEVMGHASILDDAIQMMKKKLQGVSGV